ncbi:MAG: hypothetical protein OEQ13_10710 [Acidobacteriota bacterium]|nr:hypothetical protein [Acidobacteriota bacterium]
MKKALLVLFAAVLVIAVAMFVMAPASPTIAAPAKCPKGGPVSNIFCGGVAGIECPDNLICVDDHRDDCCPQAGGTDCGGVCVRKVKK